MRSDPCENLVENNQGVLQFYSLLATSTTDNDTDIQYRV